MTMRVLFDGKGYDLAAAMYRSSNASWAKLISQTKRGPFRVAQGFGELTKMRQPQGKSELDILDALADLDEAKIVQSLTDLVFLARVEAGEDVTWEQVSAEVPFFEAMGVLASAAQEAADPEDPTTARTDSARATDDPDSSGSTLKSTTSSDTSASI